LDIYNRFMRAFHRLLRRGGNGHGRTDNSDNESGCCDCCYTDLM